MKDPPRNRRGNHKMLTPAGTEGDSKGKSKNQKWLKKNGISLQTFHNAKSMGSYNPRLIEKQRELYRNAKVVKKFKKSVKQHYPENSMLHVSVPEPEIDATEIELDQDVQRKKIQPADQERRKRKNKTLQSVREEYERKREEEEKVKMEREAIAKAKQEEKERAATKRKELRDKMFKKTRSGQPVMKFRIQHMLEGILGSSDK